MTSAPPFAHASDHRQISRALAALVLAVLTLFGGFAAIVWIGTTPTTALGLTGHAPFAASAQNPVATVSPACAAALARARASKTLPSDQAVAANTAMLRACQVP
jgi:hypothetical protein